MAYEILVVDNADTADATNTTRTAAEICATAGAAVGTPHVDITDASVAHSLNATFSHTEAETALNALGAKINLILDVLDAYAMTA
jgi:hypothetical protein